MGIAASTMGYNASKNLHNKAARRVLHAPMAFFDSTPLGRIMNRFSKDQDVIDNTLNDSFRMALSTLGSVVGAIVLIVSLVRRSLNPYLYLAGHCQPYASDSSLGSFLTLSIEYFLIAVAVILVLYYLAAHFYRASAREIKRLVSQL